MGQNKNPLSLVVLSFSGDFVSITCPDKYRDIAAPVCKDPPVWHLQ
jgi:hypothetical protein